MVREKFYNKYKNYSIEELKLRISSLSKTTTFSNATTIIALTLSLFNMVFLVDTSMHNLAESRSAQAMTIINRSKSSGKEKAEMINAVFPNSLNDYLKDYEHLISTIGNSIALVLVIAAVIHFINIFRLSIMYEVLRGKTNSLMK